MLILQEYNACVKTVFALSHMHVRFVGNAQKSFRMSLNRMMIMRHIRTANPARLM